MESTPFGASSDLAWAASSDAVELVSPSRRAPFLDAESSVVAPLPLGPEPEELDPGEALALLEGLLDEGSPGRGADRPQPPQPLETQRARSGSGTRPVRTPRRAPTRRRRRRWG